MKAKKASIANYVPYHGEGENDIMSELGKTKKIDENEDDAMV
jgi:hypothetical protein